MIVPKRALSWIKLHRTAVTGDVGDAYGQMIQRDFDEMSVGRWIPDQCASVLDIGCGMAGIDVHLFDHYDSPTLNLLDGSAQAQGGGAEINFHEEGMQPFNDMGVTQELLTANGISPGHVVMWPVGHDAEPIPCDLCISLLSWGWHYPVEAYLDLVKRSLRPGGRLILDLRSGMGGERALADVGFELISVRHSGIKGTRSCLKLPAKSSFLAYPVKAHTH